jgi:hypothetical protein
MPHCIAERLAFPSASFETPFCVFCASLRLFLALREIFSELFYLKYRSIFRLTLYTPEELMKKIGIIIFVTALVIGVVVANVIPFGKADYKFFNFSIGWGGVKGSGNAVTEKREVAGFQGVDVGGAFNVEVVAGKEFSVEVEADDNLLPLITTRVEGGVLHIGTERSISPRSALRVRISAPDIDKLDASGASKISLTGVKNSALNVSSSGASKITVEGTTGTLTVGVSGASKIDAASLQAENAEVDASGASHVYVNASNEVRADASGACKISYTGTPKNVIKKTSGASKVQER